MPVGTLKFNAPSGGWSQYSKATLHIQRTGGSASANVECRKLNNSYSGTIDALQTYYGHTGSLVGSTDVSGGNGWFSYNVASDLPSSGEFAVTLISKNAYITVDGTNAYISLSN